MTQKSNVRKIRPSWECVDISEKGDMTFQITDVPLRDLKDKEAASKKIMREMENRRKL